MEISISDAISQTRTIKSELINVSITSENTRNQIQLSAWSAKDIDISTISYDINAIKWKYPHLRDI